MTTQEVKRKLVATLTMDGIGYSRLRNFFLVATVCLTVAGIVGCHPPLKKGPEESLRPVRFFLPEFRDDLDCDSLILAIKRNLEHLNRLNPETVFQYGPRNFTCQQVRESQETFLNLLSKGLDADQMSKEIRKNFQVYQVVGQNRERRVLLTGYYEPIYEGRLLPDESSRYPLYRPPDDLIKIDLSLFGERFKGESNIAAWHVFIQFGDKGWAFTDCTSKLIMERLGISAAFSFDEHFEKFGSVVRVP
jgi:hypothetical protein